MNRTAKILGVLMALMLVMPMCLMAEKKEKKAKEPKEKKEYVWQMPAKMSGDADFDNYLRTCDTIYNRITTYRDSVTFYSVKNIQFVDKDGNPVKNAAGQDSIITAVVDKDNNIRGTGEALLQYMEMTNAGLGILNDMLSITVETASATAALALNPLMALSYGKYIKAGPKILQMGGSTVKGLLKEIKTQRNAIRAYKKNYTESGVLIDPSIDPATIEDGVFADLETIQKAEDVVGRELADALAKNASIGDIPDGEDVDIDSL